MGEEKCRGHGRERAVLPDPQVFRMGAERAAETAEAEHSVTDPEGGDAIASRFDLSGELVSQHGPSWPEQPGEEAREKRLTRPKAAVGPVHGRRVNLDDQFAVPGDWLVYLADMEHVGWPIPRRKRCLYSGTLARKPNQHR